MIESLADENLVESTNKKADPSHPYLRHLDAIREREVVVIDNIPGPPLVGNEAYIAENCLVIICHQGAITNSTNDEYSLYAHDVSILLPDQIAIPQQVTDDFLATNVAISREFYEQLRVRYPYTRNAPLFRRRPPCHLNEEQFQSVISLVNTIRTISLSDSLHRHEILVQLICVLFNMLSEYHLSNYPDEESGNDSLFSRFYENIIKHHSKSREVLYYARLQNLSPKYFAMLIKAETGIAATDWINNYVISEAKMLLDSRSDMTIQQISFHAGFSEQASFSRFFRKYTGLSPKEYRENKGRIG